MMINNEKNNNRLSQGDIYKNITYIEKINSIDDYLEIQQIVFPNVVVLTQDCDIQQHLSDVNKTKSSQLFSVLVAPLYNIAHFVHGEHLSNFKIEGESFISSKNKGKELLNTGIYVNSKGITLVNNEIPRYHVLDFSKENTELPISVVDFKHYFSISADFLEKEKNEDFICTLNPLYRELLTQRFSNYLSRIGLPNPQ